MDETPVQHDPRERKFFVPVEDGEARLTYVVAGHGQKTWEFVHVFVPTHARGRGLAEKVVVAGFEAACAAGVRVIPTCPYVAHTFLDRYPRYRLLVRGDASNPAPDAPQEERG